jgi:diguanylate cyclase (GGDEF)-like protein
VLLIEDSPSDRLLIERALQRGAVGPFELTHAPRLEDGRQWLLRRHFDCVLLDLTLPDATGLQTVEGVHQAAPELPIVVLSGLDDDGMAVASLEHGVMDYLTKARADADGLWRAVLYAMQRKRSELKLRHRALHDPLTDLANRSLFVERLTLALARTARSSRHVAVLFLDLDRFKWVNDTFGHQVGDRVLMEVAERLRAALRPTDLAARLGGDEFLVLCEDLITVADARVVADRVKEVLLKPLRLDDVELRIATSIGIAICADPACEPEALLREADSAMYRAKVSGKATQRSFGTSGVRLPSSHARVRAVGPAVDDGERLVVQYRPIIDLTAGAVRGVEAVVGGDDLMDRPRPLAEFVDVLALGDGVATVVDAVLREVARSHLRWSGRLDDGYCAVALPGEHAIDLTLPERVGRILSDAGVDPGWICVEVAETAIARRAEIAGTVLSQLKEVGLRLAIGAFGSGAMSLSLLRSLPVDVVVLDRSLLSSVDRDPVTDAIVRAVLGVGASLGLEVVAAELDRPDEVRHFARLGGGVARGPVLGSAARAEELHLDTVWQRSW